MVGFVKDNDLVITRALQFRGKKPPIFASPNISVNGDFAVTVSRELLGTRVPERGLAPNIRTFCGLRASTSGFTNSNSLAELKPLAPRYFLAKAGESASLSIFPVVKSIFRTVPAQP